MSFNSPIAVITDVDGLILDSESWTLKAWGLACKELGFELPHAVGVSGVGKGRSQFKLQLSKHFGADFDVESATKLRIEIGDAMIAKEGLLFRPGAEEFIETIRKRGIPFGLATSTARLDALKRLHCSGVNLEAFQAMTFGDEITHLKPDPEIYLTTAEKLGVSPSEVIAFEDSSAGVSAALAAGMRVVCIPDMEKHSPAKSEKLLLLDSLHDYLGLLKN